MRLFDELTEEVGLELVASKTFRTGVLAVTYRPENVR